MKCDNCGSLCHRKLHVALLRPIRRAACQRRCHRNSRCPRSCHCHFATHRIHQCICRIWLSRLKRIRICDGIILRMPFHRAACLFRHFRRKRNFTAFLAYGKFKRIAAHRERFNFTGTLRLLLPDCKQLYIRRHCQRPVRIRKNRPICRPAPAFKLITRPQRRLCRLTQALTNRNCRIAGHSRYRIRSGIRPKRHIRRNTHRNRRRSFHIRVCRSPIRRRRNSRHAICNCCHYPICAYRCNVFITAVPCHRPVRCIIRRNCRRKRLRRPGSRQSNVRRRHGNPFRRNSFRIFLRPLNLNLINAWETHSRIRIHIFKIKPEMAQAHTGKLRIRHCRRRASGTTHRLVCILIKILPRTVFPCRARLNTNLFGVSWRSPDNFNRLKLRFRFLQIHCQPLRRLSIIRR